MVGGTWTDSHKKMPESAVKWLSNKAWCSICELAQTVSVFKDFDSEFE